MCFCINQRPEVSRRLAWTMTRCLSEILFHSTSHLSLEYRWQNKRKGRLGGTQTIIFAHHLYSPSLLWRTLFFYIRLQFPLLKTTSKTLSGTNSGPMRQAENRFLWYLVITRVRLPRICWRTHWKFAKETSMYLRSERISQMCVFVA